jgi:hypothetical protein
VTNKPEFIKDCDVKKHRENWTNLINSVGLYKTVSKRNAYLFDWLLYMWENLYISSVDKKYVDSLAIVKTKIAVLDTLIDDVADNPSETRDVFFDELLRFAFDRDNIDWEELTEKEGLYVKATIMVWDDVLQTLKKYPRFREFEFVFNFDVHQLMNSMRFSRTINKMPIMNNILENNIYGHHGMTVMMCGTVDLMCSPDFNADELPLMRKVLYYSQQLARLGNMVNTYPREITEKDVSSEVITMAIEEGIVSTETFKMGETNNLESELERLTKFFREYYHSLNVNIEEIGRKITSIDIDEYMKERDFIQRKYEERDAYWETRYKNRLYVDDKNESL